jgi:amidase
MATTAGSLALAGPAAPRDAFLAERLRAAGAVLLAKTNLSEWANFRSTHSSSGWSGQGRQAKNPYVLTHNPCGSSNGACVAASLAAASVGTETDGSIVCPASANALVGIKPTIGVVSRSGIIPISHSQDTAGPMARSVADAALLLNALAGADPRDRATTGNRGRVPADYAAGLDPDALRGARIGVARKRFFGYSEETDRLAEEALRALREGGAVLVDPADIPHAGEYDDDEFAVLLYEFKADLNAYLAGRGPAAPIRTLRDAIDFNERNRAEEMPYFGQEIFQMAQEKGPLTEPAYRAALAKCGRLSRAEGIDAVMARHRLDAIVAPTGHPPWPTDLVNGDHFLGASSTPAAVAGYPNVSVPMGYVHALPVGLSFIGRAWSEPTLIRLAYAFEQATKHRAAPRYLPALELR